MLNLNQLPRLARLFNPGSERCFDVALDHGFFGEYPFIAGIENMPRAVAKLIDANPDAIQLAPGQAHLLQGVPGKDKPALVLRTDIANAYGNPLDDYLFSVHFPDAVAQAVRLDAACVVANLLHLPGRPNIREACIRSIMALREACTAAGMPLMIEPLVMQDNKVAGGYMVDGDTNRIIALVRQARELGADLIKADPTDNVAEYHKIVEAAVVPVLVRGGGRVPDEELISRTVNLLNEGASGIVYGRNVIQHPNPAAITRALMAVLHKNASASEALEVLKEES